MERDARIFQGERSIDAIPLFDRGLAYGDGLFETMRAWRGDVPWWDRHWRRLEAGASALGIALPVPALARAEVRSLLDGRDSVMRLAVTRGVGSRGYAPVAGPPTWWISRHPVPAVPAGIALRWCDTRLAIQPRLAGHKHANRLEQVLARGEWTADDDADEGLMLDTEGTVVSAVAGNVFARVDGAWVTPLVDRCGVRGVCRDWAIGALGASEARLLPGDIERADALFVCNAVRGILEVTRLGDRHRAPHPLIAGLRARLAAEHPAFAPNPETP